MPDDLPLPSVEVLVALVVSLREELVATRAELERARTRIAELEVRLAANSANSSKPPERRATCVCPSRSGTAVSFQDEFRFIVSVCRRLRQLVHRNLEMPDFTAVSRADIYIQRLSSSRVRPDSTS